MNAFRFVSVATGELHPSHFFGPESAVALNTPSGYVAVAVEELGAETLAEEVVPTLDPAWLPTRVRQERVALLIACDWTQMPDTPIDPATRNAWVTYRQALRDITAQVGFPGTVVWPTPPA